VLIKGMSKEKIDTGSKNESMSRVKISLEELTKIFPAISGQHWSLIKKNPGRGDIDLRQTLKKHIIREISR